MHYSLEEGVDKIVETLTDYSERYGDRFKPVKGWKQVK